MPITLEEYLEQALEDRSGASRRAKENNRIRHSFKALFQDRQVSCSPSNGGTVPKHFRRI